MERTRVNSEAIRSIGHDEESGTLEVEFQSGAVHEYTGISAKQHRDLINALSIGRHFVHNIRDRHRSIRKT